jgi:hypothetical protein
MAIQKIQELGKTLKKELKKGLKKSPVEAVEVCHTKAPSIPKNLSNKKIEIGRVSLKNRNPDNYPQDWMLTTINEFHQNKIQNKYKIVSLDDGYKGLLMPIRTIPLCLKCHGTHISPKVKKVINSKYPKDKAYGYKVGDIRGFFWAKYKD